MRDTHNSGNNNTNDKSESNQERCNLTREPEPFLTGYFPLRAPLTLFCFL